MVAGRLGRRIEGNGARIEIRHAHVHRDQAVIAHPRVDGAAGAAQAELAAELRGAGVHQGGDTACAIAALFDFTAIGIEHAVERPAVRIAGSFQHQCLVEADTGVPVGEGAKQP